MTLYANAPARKTTVIGDVVDYISPDGKIIGPFVYTGIPLWSGSPLEGRLTKWLSLPLGLPDTGPDVNGANSLVLVFDGLNNRRVPQ